MKLIKFKLKKLQCFLAGVCLFGVGVFICGMLLWCKKVKTESGFEKIEQGDFSILFGLSDKQRTTLQNVYSNHQKNDDMEWLYADINADGTEELIFQEKEPAERERKRIVAVFAITANGYERILWDISDNTEYYFIANRKLVYYCFHSGIYYYSSYSICCFDESWNENIEKKLEVFEITDLELYAECPDYWWNIAKPDVDKEGYYYRITRYEDDTEKEDMISADEWFQIFEKEVGETEKYGPNTKTIPARWEQGISSDSDSDIGDSQQETSDDILYFTVLEGETLVIDKERIYDEYYGLHRLDNRWELDETDKILSSLKGKWKTDQYVGFVDQSIYYPDLYDRNDNLDDDAHNELYQMYNEKIETARSIIPEIEISIREYNDKNISKNYIYTYAKKNYASPVSIILSMSRSDDNYPVFVESTTITGDFSVEYPVMYIKFFICVEEGMYEPATLVITSDKKLYMLIDGAFYSLVRDEN